MFTRVYFARTFFQETYFMPVDGSTPPVVSDLPPLTGMICNIGTMMGRR